MLPQALSYQLKVRDHFKKQASTWEWFAAARTREEQLVSFQTELLKNTYQFRRGTDTALYEKIDLVREKLGLGDLPITAYQAQNANDPELNASIVYLHSEAHLVFSGPILEKLNEAELLAVIAHELTHIRLYTLLDGDLEVADRIITALANNYTSDPPYYETARLFRLYTEIFCDRGAYAVLGDAGPVITLLVKIATGLSEVNAESYIKQAEEVFSAEPGMQSGMPTHPENFIRARALKLWHEEQVAAAAAGGEAEGGEAGGENVAAPEGDVAQQEGDRTAQEGDAAAAGSEEEQGKTSAPETGRAERNVVASGSKGGPGAEEAIVRMIEGKPELDRLDLFSQRELNELTALFLREYLRPKWLQSTLIMGLVRSYFPAGLGMESGGVDRLIGTITGAHPSIRDYFAYVLLDFVLADPSLEEMPAGRAFEFAEEMQLTATYDLIYKKELQLSDKKWQQYKQKVLEAFAKATKDQSIL